MHAKPILIGVATVVATLIILSIVKVTSKGQKKSLLDLITSK